MLDYKRPWFFLWTLLVTGGLLIEHLKVKASPSKGEPLTSCNSTSPINTSKDICGDLCEKGAKCSDSGACLCKKEPVPSRLGGQFVHCTNWNYVDQEECKTLAKAAGKNDTRVCWTWSIGNYCTCY